MTHRVLIVDDEAGIFDRQLRCHHRELQKAVQLAGLLLAQVLLRYEVFHLAGDFRIVKTFDNGDGLTTAVGVDPAVGEGKLIETISVPNLCGSKNR